MPVTFTNINTYTFSKQVNTNDSEGYVDVRNQFCKKLNNSQLSNNYIDNTTYLFIAVGY